MSFESNPSNNMELEKSIDKAKESFKKQDFDQALEQISSVITSDPVNKKALSLLKSIFKTPGFDITNLTENDSNDLSIGELAVSVCFFGYTQKYNQALLNLSRLLLLSEETLYLYWLEEWLTDKDFFTILTLDGLKKTLIILMELPNQAEFNYNIREIYEFFLRLLQQAGSYYTFDDKLIYIMAVIARRSLQFHKSILLAAKSYGEKPSYLNTLALAYAYRELNDYDNTVRFFQEAISFKPENIEVKIDLADFLSVRTKVNSTDYKKMIKLYRDVVDMKPFHPWAYPSYLFYVYTIESDNTFLDLLEKFAKEQPDNTRAQTLLIKSNTFLNKEKSE